MIKFDFITDAETQEYCESTVRAMMKLFGITEDEAVGRINQRWSGVTMVGADDLLYHESVTYWANDIYYGHDSGWWLGPSGLRPLPYTD